MTVVLLTLLLGTAALILGAELLVRGASRLAAAAGISSLVVGLTVVSFGTSAPELAVTLGSALTGRPDVGVGNVVGSNILNIFFILGISAAIRPLVVSHGLVRREVPILIGVTLMVWLLAADGSLERLEGLALLVGAFFYAGFLIWEARRAGEVGLRRAEAEAQTEADKTGADDEEVASDGALEDEGSPTREGSDSSGGWGGWGGWGGSEGSGESEESEASGESGEPGESGESGESGGAPGRNVLLVLAGLILLLVGARWLVEGAVTIATAVGVSQAIIGLTVVALGTSLPEVATSALAAIRGERDIAVGNVVGSNVFNLTLILGSGSALVPGGLSVARSVLTFDVPIMAAATIACLPVFFTGYRIARWEGWLFLGYYLAYTLYLILAASRHDALDEYSTVMTYFVVPLTVVTLVLLAARAWQTPNHGREEHDGRVGDAEESQPR